jgi:prepilin-type N-terminal cleavage/methylation domain-containing protein
VAKAALKEKCKETLGSKAGLSLIETIIAAAIVAIAALILVSFVYTLTGVSKRSADLSEADAKLTETIALDPDDPDADSNPMDITLNGITINTTRNTYEIDIGEFSTFSYPPSSAGTP